jgi:hypothetical protein
MRRRLVTIAFALGLTMATPAAAEQVQRYGSLLLGPRVGGGLGHVSGPRGGYYLGLELTYVTPRYFYYDFEVGFAHLLPTTVSVPETSGEGLDGSAVTLAPGHDADVTGLYGVPLTMEVGLHVPLRRVAIRLGVGFGAMFTIQTLESFGSAEQEFIASFCFRPEIGLDFPIGPGALRLDLFYLWQDANWQSTGNDRDVDSLFLTLGYGFRIAG